MTGLPYVAENIKSVIKWSAIVAAGIAALWILWLILIFLFNILFPTPTNVPDYAFGSIRKPFTYNSTLAAKIFSLDTPGGKIDDSVKILPVYAIPVNQGEFASLDNARTKARSGGLDSEPSQISETEWRWTNTRNPNKSLRFDIVTNNFVYHYDWVTDTTSLDGVFKTTEKLIIEKARSYLNSFKSLQNDLKKGSTRVTYFKISGNDRRQVGSFSEANAAKVEIFRNNVDGKFFLAETDPSLAEVNVLISPASNTEKQLLEINYKYWSYDTAQVGTYQIRSGMEAYTDLTSGNAFVVTGAKQNFDSVSIQKVSLAYFNPNIDQRYLQPIFIFTGSGSINGANQDFVAYVPAITKDYQR